MKRLIPLAVAVSIFAMEMLAPNGIAARAFGQNSSLYQQPAPMMVAPPQANTNNGSSSAMSGNGGRALMPAGGMVRVNESPLQSASWTYVPSQPARTLKIHDIVTIRVDEMTQSTAQGNASSRKSALYDARLQDWIRFDGLAMRPDPQTTGDPRVQGTENEVYRANSTLQTKESLTLNIAGEIADIRPNGTIVLTAQKTITINDNVFEMSLTGICRGEDITPDGTVLSRHVHNLDIKKDDRGHVRDGYSRGWFTRFLARVKPF